MPRGNGTGPEGRGRMTGRGAGYCAGYGLPGYANFSGGPWLGGGLGRGLGRGSGRGSHRGFGRGLAPCLDSFPVPFAPARGRMPSADIERWNLERQAEYLEEELESIRGRLEALGRANESTEDDK